MGQSLNKIVFPNSNYGNSETWEGSKDYGSEGYESYESNEKYEGNEGCEPIPCTGGLNYLVEESMNGMYGIPDPSFDPTNGVHPQWLVYLIQETT
jgi:hypothetical protein